jgi:hypothetical protein
VFQQANSLSIFHNIQFTSGAKWSRSEIEQFFRNSNEPNFFLPKKKNLRGNIDFFLSSNEIFFLMKICTEIESFENKRIVFNQN